MREVFTCVGWQVTLCDPISQVTPCDLRWVSHEELYAALTFTLPILDPDCSLPCQAKMRSECLYFDGSSDTYDSVLIDGRSVGRRVRLQLCGRCSAVVK